LHPPSLRIIFIYLPQIQIPSPLRQYSGKQASVDVPGKTVGEALAGLVAQHPDLKRHLYTDDGKLRAFVNVYVNDEDMRYLQKEATALKDGDTISIVPSIAGGCCPGVTDSSGVRALVIIGFECHGWSRTLPRPPAEIDSIQ
jgi:adenylyltransferase/sulfurtransferase